MSSESEVLKVREEDDSVERDSGLDTEAGLNVGLEQNKALPGNAQSAPVKNTAAPTHGMLFSLDNLPFGETTLRRNKKKTPVDTSTTTSPSSSQKSSLPISTSTSPASPSAVSATSSLALAPPAVVLDQSAPEDIVIDEAAQNDLDTDIELLDYDYNSRSLNNLEESADSYLGTDTYDPCRAPHALPYDPEIQEDILDNDKDATSNTNDELPATASQSQKEFDHPPVVTHKKKKDSAPKTPTVKKTTAKASTSTKKSTRMGSKGAINPKDPNYVHPQPPSQGTVDSHSHVLIKIPPVETIKYPCFFQQMSPEQKAQLLVEYEMYPQDGPENYATTIPFKGKGTYFTATGRPGFDVIEYRFTAVGGEKAEKMTWWIMWDYHTGLVKVRDMFACCKPGKTEPGNAIKEKFNPGLAEMCHNITGGNLHTQGYWLPYKAARALAAKLCYNIRFALVPIFGLDFPDECLPVDHEDYGKYAIDSNIIDECAIDCKTQLAAELKRLEQEAKVAQLNPTPTTSKRKRRPVVKPAAQVDSQGDTAMMDIAPPNTTTGKRKRRDDDDILSEHNSSPPPAGQKTKKQRPVPEPLTLTPASSASPLAGHSPTPSLDFRRSQSLPSPIPHNLETPSRTPIGIFDPVRNSFMMPSSSGRNNSTTSSTKNSVEPEGMDDIIPGTTRTRRQEIEQLTRNQASFCHKPNQQQQRKEQLPSWMGATEAFDYDRNIRQKQTTNEKVDGMMKELAVLKNTVHGQNSEIDALKRRLAALEGGVAHKGDKEAEEAANALLTMEG